MQLFLWANNEDNTKAPHNRFFVCVCVCVCVCGGGGGGGGGGGDHGWPDIS